MKNPLKKPIPWEMRQLGTCLKRLRAEIGFSIHRVAREIHITPSYLSKIEAGNAFSTISIQTLVKLSGIYELPISSILKEAGFIETDGYDLPSFAVYLRIKYGFSTQAIRDMEMAKEIVEKKYPNLKQ